MGYLEGRVDMDGQAVLTRRRLRFAKIDGTGTMKLALPHPSGEGLRTDIAEASVLLVGRDGTSVCVGATPEGVELRVGDYRITLLSLRLAAEGRGQVWSYLFSSAFEPTEDDWTTVSKGEAWEFDPVGTLDFQLDVVDPKDSAAPGTKIAAQPLKGTTHVQRPPTGAIGVLRRHVVRASAVSGATVCR